MCHQCANWGGAYPSLPSRCRHSARRRPSRVCLLIRGSLVRTQLGEPILRPGRTSGRFA